MVLQTGEVKFLSSSFGMCQAVSHWTRLHAHLCSTQRAMNRCESDFALFTAEHIQYESGHRLCGCRTGVGSTDVQAQRVLPSNFKTLTGGIRAPEAPWIHISLFAAGPSGPVLPHRGTALSSSGPTAVAAAAGQCGRWIRCRLM